MIRNTQCFICYISVRISSLLFLSDVLHSTSTFVFKIKANITSTFSKDSSRQICCFRFLSATALWTLSLLVSLLMYTPWFFCFAENCMQQFTILRKNGCRRDTSSAVPIRQQRRFAGCSEVCWSPGTHKTPVFPSLCAGRSGSAAAWCPAGRELSAPWLGRTGTATVAFHYQKKKAPQNPLPEPTRHWQN